ncbi:CDP-alcohol phosphatidyltransferase family protein [Fulvimarina sp. 2208YS6-2-32]|uniref:CDP-alcohol phosphatidyltransferase family protein n=1 Tax=Fulvimarina uroteuthidis TaxID=3098149 RepID=A0ABU5I1Y7_9HYPH|nr:CDP-alcohol phosphatidyltransferase family protein [Fulvimarina sp. 2208YS6-2-32]MDY8109381.1 CDP-alcohol phosphatidyltransferase family protein [Fulvimarina sp. 2208YS6-2-32]
MSETGLEGPAISARFERGRLRVGIRPLFLEALGVFTVIALILGIAAPTAALQVGSDWRFIAVALFVYLGMSALATSGLRVHPHKRFGAANMITSFRAGLTALVAASLIEAEQLGVGGDEAFTWALTGIVLLSLALDGVDGYAARKTGTSSDFGARFDMEVDAFLVLTLSCLAFASGKAEIFVILLGAMRYLYLALHALLPKLPGDLAPSYVRKAICVFQVAALCLIMTPVVMPPLSNWIALLALVLLLGSFGHDLYRQVSRYGQRKADPR